LVDEGSGKVVIFAPLIRFRIEKAPGAKLILNGNLRVLPHLGGNESSYISLGRGSELRIENDFTIGNGVRIAVADGARLTIGGRSAESGSGITSNSTIMVHHRVTIGCDLVCAWGVFITDSDWHTINGQQPQSDVLIGDRVWIAHGSSVLKGSELGTGSIVASHSVVSRIKAPSASLIAGAPAKIVRTGVCWSRDLPA
jgi:acetyltransferase-like isoleucine patch superfamily enzyme